MEHPVARLAQCLDVAQGMLLAGEVSEGMELLANVLLAARVNCDAPRWKAAVTNVCRGHEILATLLLDPFTSRSFYKPRGYPGDAELLDLIYRIGPCDALLRESTDIGRLIYQYSSNRDAPNAVRWRCRHVAELIDDLSQRKGPLRVLSIACGHARELMHCRAVRAGGITELVALDADVQSLGVLADAHIGAPVTTIAANVTTLLRRECDLGTFDLVYSLGLFDYLPHRTATRVVAAIEKLLRPGGHALVANFATNLLDVGYMEAFMDWWLVYRDEHILRQLCHDAGIDRFETYSDPSRCLALLMLAGRT